MRINKKNRLYAELDLNNNLTPEELSKMLGYSVNTARKYLRDWQKDRGIEPKKSNWEKTVEIVKNKPNITNKELAKELGVKINTATTYLSLLQKETPLQLRDKALKRTYKRLEIGEKYEIIPLFIWEAKEDKDSAFVGVITAEFRSFYLVDCGNYKTTVLKNDLYEAVKVKKIL